MRREHRIVVLSNQLRNINNVKAKLELAAEVLTVLGTMFDEQTVEILADEIGPTLYRWVDTVPETVNSAFLRALALSRANRRGASAAWERFFTLHAGRDAFHLLAYAQTLTEEQRFEEAARQLRLALTRHVPYAFFPRAEKVIAKVASEDFIFAREVRIAVLSTSTTSLMIPVLKALSLRDRIRAEFYQGLYGAIDQEILDPQSGLGKFRPEIVFLIPNWRDLSLPALSPNEKTAITRLLEVQKALWQRLYTQFGCHVVQHAYDLPTEEPLGYLAGSLPGGRSRLIQLINTYLSEEAPPYVSILDTPAVQRRVGERWEDSMLWCSFKQHPSTEALPDLAEAQQAHLRAVLGLTRKVLVTDLDNTLWKGIIGEDGLEGIQIGPGTAVGEGYQRLQKYLLDLKNRGILLAACSKNNPEDARLPFEKHEHMALRLDDFAAFYANWEDKAQNLRQIAQKLSLGLDSFVFLDDNPLEREWVRSQLPEVTVVDLGPSVFQWVRDLDRGYHFFSLILSKEDLARSEQYRTESQREMIRTSSHSIEEFLSQLQLDASVVPVSESNLARVTQLINKTNQFNLTTKRYTEAQVLQLASSPGAWTGAFQLRDRMGNYGLVGVILCKPNSNAHEWAIDIWLMSCRALGRQLERFMFDRMMEAAVTKGVKEVKGIFRPSGKNGLVANLYDSLGFCKLHECVEQSIYTIEVPPSPEITATYIRNVSAATREQHS